MSQVLELLPTIELWGQWAHWTPLQSWYYQPNYSVLDISDGNDISIIVNLHRVDLYGRECTIEIWLQTAMDAYDQSWASLLKLDSFSAVEFPVVKHHYFQGAGAGDQAWPGVGRFVRTAICVTTIFGLARICLSMKAVLK